MKSLPTCLRAQYCLYPETCDFWKQKHCTDASVKAIMQAISGNVALLDQTPREQELLLARSQHTSSKVKNDKQQSSSEVKKALLAQVDHERTDSMEETFGRKRC